MLLRFPDGISFSSRIASLLLRSLLLSSVDVVDNFDSDTAIRFFFAVRRSVVTCFFGECTFSASVSMGCVVVVSRASALKSSEVSVQSLVSFFAMCGIQSPSSPEKGF